MDLDPDLQSVVVVEDDPDIRDAICDMLKFEGYPVVSYENGKDALEHLHETPNPGIIFLDLMMPVMNGVQFLRARQNDDVLSEIPCFVVSAVGKENELLREGAQGFLHKPVDANEILSIVKAYLHPEVSAPRTYLH